MCDRLTIRIHTQFTGHPTETHNVLLTELDQPDRLALLRRIWLEPESFRPRKTSRDITEEAAKSFATLAAQLRKTGHDPQKVSHFLTQCLFCFFAEDVGLLPDRLFEKMINAKLDLPTKTGLLPSEKLTRGLATLFESMRTGDLFGVHDIARFNGGLFKNIDVPKLDIMNVTELRNAADKNWSAIDVSIFGTLFERGLDPGKRSQLGAHYTDPATIMRIVEPVLQRPLLQIWEQLVPVIRALLTKSARKGDKHYKAAQVKFIDWLDQLKNYRVLDPACGSGNFLFLGLKVLKDIEHKSHLEAAAMGLDREADLVTGPHNMLGIELNEYAAELARVTVWIGELQWRLLHGYEFKTNPVLEPLDHIECRDALLSFGADGAAPVEADWPKASVVIGNPPFLGQRFQVRELGEAYVKSLRAAYSDKVTGNVDLVCYWFVKALNALKFNGLGAAGFVATNSIRGGDNRAVLSPIADQFHIFNAWSDEPWVNEGAAVRVSLVSFGNATTHFELNGQPVARINADLSASRVGEANVDLTTSVALPESQKAAFSGFQMNGNFNVTRDHAAGWLGLPNPNGKSSSLVLHPYANASDITKRSRDEWLIDFTGFSESEAALFEAPFKHVQMFVRPERAKKREPYLLEKYWLHKRSSPDMRKAIKPLERFIATPMVSKYRLFAWLPTIRIPENAAIVIARADDTTYGILHSRFHECWSLRMGTFMGVGNDPRYTPTTCFETFPFPVGLTPADTAHQRTEEVEGGALIPAGISEQNEPLAQAKWAQEAIKSIALRASATRIAIAAKRLNDLREAWLNPPEWTQRVPEVIPLGMGVSPYPDRILPRPGHEKDLAERTLTKLYNQRPAWLDAAHKALDVAVAAAYGWADYSADMADEEILKRLLALNLARSAGGKG
nr:DNA methyltransferase [Polaromonas sp. UBA4122]